MSKDKRWALVVDSDLAVFTYGGEVVFTWKEPPAMSSQHVAMIQEAYERGLLHGTAFTPEQMQRGHEVVCDLQAFLDDLAGDNP